MESKLDNVLNDLKSLKEYLIQHKGNKNYYYDFTIYKNKSFDNLVYCNRLLSKLKEDIKAIENGIEETVINEELEDASINKLDSVLQDLFLRKKKHNHLLNYLKESVKKMEYININ